MTLAKFLSRFKRNLLIIFIALASLTAALGGDQLFDPLSLTRTAISQGQYWRLLTGNLVHFGWAHTLMNLAAFLLCSFALLSELKPLRFASLFMGCCFAVGLGIYYLNPELATYAGLSGVVHGLIIAGLWYTKRHPLWLRVAALAIVIGKIIQEHSANYQANELQALIPVPVAVDAHLYGALAGATFVSLDVLSQRLIYQYKRSKN